MSLSIPSSISTGSTDSNWASLVPTPGASDTSTKKHYSAVSYTSAADLVFELNNGVVTVDVNPAGTGTDWPDSVSKTGFQTNGTSSITVTTNDTIYIFNNGSTNFGSFVWQSSWVTTSGGSGGFLSSGASGTLSYDVPNEVITWTISSDSPTSNSNNVYSVGLDGTNTSVGPLSHTNGQVSSATISSSGSLLGNWRLFHVQNPGQGSVTDTLAQLNVGGGAPPPTTPAGSSSRKVFCNFW